MTTAIPTLDYLNPATIIVRDRLRKVLPKRVEALRPHIRGEGVQQPIEVVATAEGHRLIKGAHRLAAVLAEAMVSLPALVYPEGSFGSEAEIRGREISENFFRFELNALEHAVNIAEWRDVHETLHGKAKRGRKIKAALTDETIDELSANFALNFTDIVQETLGLSRRAVYLALKVASIESLVRDQIADHRVAANQSELLAIAGEPPARQQLIADQLLQGAQGVADAIARIDDTPEPVVLAAWERMSEKFARLKPIEQQRFFALHEEPFRAWLAGQKH